MTRAGIFTDAPVGPLVRLRPICPESGEPLTWIWRCFCYTDEPARVCDCEAHGVWSCEWHDVMPSGTCLAVVVGSAVSPRLPGGGA